ncbi:hypothetical protein BDZ94DRAFT_1312251 [Collybia nuda]|uniref:DUF6697 domain-containing protein n=1 Tax=Collybia nuda TaxID=64659 RepID=A0A9P5XXM4_9AGAR|nr:hypothetical protein BDZ94DRAFT_1312251 [Collybia nuda]
MQAPPLTKEEWANQKPKVCRAWAKHELGREPTVFELNRALKTRSEYTHIMTDQVSEAFLRGEETMAVYTLQCVGYDVVFQLNLAEKSPVWIPPPPKPKGFG